MYSTAHSLKNDGGLSSPLGTRCSKLWCTVKYSPGLWRTAIRLIVYTTASMIHRYPLSWLAFAHAMINLIPLLVSFVELCVPPWEPFRQMMLKTVGARCNSIDAIIPSATGLFTYQNKGVTTFFHFTPRIMLSRWPYINICRDCGLHSRVKDPE